MDSSWYEGAGIAAIDLHYHLMNSLVRRGVMSQTDMVDVLDSCLHDMEEREASIPEASKLQETQARAHVEALLRAARAALPPGPRPR